MSLQILLETVQNKMHMSQLTGPISSELRNSSEN